MFRDTDEAVARLSAELLAEEDAPKQRSGPAREPDPDAEDALFDAELADLLRDAPPTPYRNYANGYEAEVYNSDDLDVDPEALSEELDAPERSNRGLMITAVVLLVCIVAVMLYWALFLL